MKSSIVVVALFLLVASSVSEAQLCPGDINGDGSVTVDEIVASVDSALNGCGDGVRFIDNGDGTISDYETGLKWEKKADLDNVEVNCTSAGVCPDPHDADNLYTLSTGSPYNPNGTAYTVLLAQLNASGFAGHTDWRLPTLEELQSIADYADTTAPVVNAVFDTSCSASCAVTSCSCTVSYYYWSSSTFAAVDSSHAWNVDFTYGLVIFTDSKTTGNYARAVRTGL